MATIHIDEALQYEMQMSSHPAYRTSKVIPINNTTITLGNSIFESQIEVPQKCFNLAKSTLDFRLDYVHTAGTTGFNNFLSLGQTYIDSIFLKTREGLDIVSLYNVDAVTRAVTPYIIRKEDFTENPRNVGSTTALLSTQDQGFNAFRSQEAVTSGPGGVAPLQTRGNALRVDVAGAAFIAGADAYDEPQRFIQTLAADDATADLYRQFSIPLGLIAPHSLLSLNKSLYFGQALIMVIRWSQVSRIGWRSAAAAGTTPVALDGVMTVNNLQLRLAVENNQEVVKSLVDRVNTVGMSLTIPYVYSYVYSVASSAANATHQQRYNRSHGKKLLNVYSFSMQTAALANLDTDINNLLASGLVDGVNMSKINSFNPQLNNVTLSEYPISCLTAEDYELMKPVIKGSCVANVNQYRYDRVWVQSWRKGKSCNYIDCDDINDGVDLDVELNYSIDYTMGASAPALRLFQVAVVQRTLTVNPGGTISLI